MNWQIYQSYRVFDEFLQRFVLERKSYITTHEQRLDFDLAFEVIHRRYILGADPSKKEFDEKVTRQFADADLNSRIVFSHAEYLWCMPTAQLRPETKRALITRWFADSEVKHGDDYFFWEKEAIANPGSRYLRKKYHELVSVLRILRSVTLNSGLNRLQDVKARIAEGCYEAIYNGVSSDNPFYVKDSCGVHPALMHLAAPDTYEAIVSNSHKTKICAVFSNVASAEEFPCPERRIGAIRERLFNRYGAGAHPDDKRRWFFYMDDVKPLWFDKGTKTKRNISAARFEVEQEELAQDLEQWIEGGRKPISGYRILRSSKRVIEAKVRDDYTCRACGFHFENEIVQAHHLNPLAERDEPEATTPEDLITLCPNCHYLAHYLLRQKGGGKYKVETTLLRKLRGMGQT